VGNFFRLVLSRYYTQQIPLPIGVLFGGLSGVGKTTMARVIGSSLNCKNRNGVDPCGECASCKAIWRGEGGVWEIDASFFGLIENIRELRGRLTSFSFSEYQVVILDECHMMSREAFNVLLKLLEDPPEKVLFVLVTTEPEKVLDTVRSRLIEFRFRALPNKLVLDYLKELLKTEGVSYEESLLQRIYFLSNYNFRDVLMNLEYLAIIGEGKITVDVVERALGNIFLFDQLLENLLKGDFEKSFELYAEFSQFQSNSAIFLQNLINFVVESLKWALKEGRDATKYMVVLRCTYKFLHGRLVIKGEAAIKLLLFDIISALRGPSVVEKGSVAVLRGSEILDELIKVDV
jgi:DNA polymerase-3 subunit gamma/tau